MGIFGKKKPKSPAPAAAAASPLQRFQQAQRGASPLQTEHDRLASTELLIKYDAPIGSLPAGYGPSPGGDMRIEINTRLQCPGFGSGGTIVMKYDLPSSIQRPYHKHPNIPYDGDKRFGYLPNTSEGRQLLTRFKHAFRTGHMFLVGYSITSRRDNQVTWSTIPNKTSLQGGPYGFPDPHYLQKANLELDKLGVPAADSCVAMVQHPSSSSSNSFNAIPVATMNTSMPPTRSSIDDDENDDYSYPVRKQMIRYDAPKSVGGGLQDALEPVSNHAPQPYVPSTVQGSVPLSTNFPPAAVAPVAPIRMVPASQTTQPAPIITASDLLLDPTMPLPPPIPCPIKAPTLSNGSSTSKQECSICLESVFSGDAAVRIKACGHVFHEKCINDAIQHLSKCPMCRRPLAEPQGKSPSGVMKIDLIDKPCPGFTTDSTISIVYDIPAGRQEEYHESPGRTYYATTRVAYLPHNNAGRELLVRLIYAWQHGLTFRVGTSLTTSSSDSVTWASIHHKTSLYGGAHGFPDPRYLQNCHDSLDALHVPAAEDCV